MSCQRITVISPPVSLVTNHLSTKLTNSLSNEVMHLNEKYNMYTVVVQRYCIEGSLVWSLNRATRKSANRESHVRHGEI